MEQRWITGRVTLTFLIGILAQNGFGQTSGSFSLRGNVLQADSHIPVKYATIEIRAKGGIVRTEIADSLGAFFFDSVQSGKVEITITAVGYNALKDSTITGEGSASFRQFYLTPSGKELASVTVTSLKPLIKQEIDRLVYNASSDEENKMLNLSDMMKKIPLLSVDADDNLLLSGKRSFRVLLDGKPSVLFDNNLKSVLRSMSASNILRVEVITVVPSKYEGEGLAGVINIITNKRRYDGYEASISSSLGTFYSSLGGTIDLKKGKWGHSVNVGLGLDRLPGSPSSRILESNESIAFKQTQTGSRKFKGNSFYGGITSSVEIDSLNLLTINAGMTTERTKDKAFYSLKLFEGAGLETQSYNLRETDRLSTIALDLGANYQKGFRRNKNQLLTFFYRFTKNLYDFNGLNETTERHNYSMEDIQQGNKSRFNEHVGQVDFVTTLKSITIEAGVKNIYRTNTSEFHLNRYDPTANEFEEDRDQFNKFNYGQNIAGIYNSYYLKYKSFGAKLGLRVERTSNDAHFATSNSDINQNYTNFFPSLILQKLSKTGTNSFRLGYNMRLQRPGITLLNPFVDQSNPVYYTTGNPNLLPVRNHNIEFTFTRIKKSSITGSLAYSFANNTIQLLSVLQDDSVVLSSYQNIGENDALALNLNLNVPVSKKVSLTANGSFSHVWINGYFESDQIYNKGWQGFVYGYFHYKPEKTVRISLRGGYYGPNIYLQGKSNSYVFSSLIVSKQVLKQMGSVSISLNNPLQKYRKIVNVVNTSNANIETIENRYFRNYSIGFNYRFGQLKSEIKKNRRTIINDDKISTNKDN